MSALGIGTETQQLARLDHALATLVGCEEYGCHAALREAARTPDTKGNDR